jgi:protein ImuA
MNNGIDSSRRFAMLKRRIEALNGSQPGSGSLFGLGDAALDARLGGGLGRGCLHEITGEDGVSASGFAAMLGLRAAPVDQPILWVETDRHSAGQGLVYGPGLVALGIDPARIILINAPDDLAALRVAADVMGCFGVGAAIVEAGAGKRLDLTASRKLVLAAEQTGVTGFLIRAGGSPFSSAASTRWHVSAAASALLPGEAPGRPAFHLSLLRHRGGVVPFSTLMEWDGDAQSFCEPGLSGALLPLPAGGTLAGAGAQQAA